MAITVYPVGPWVSEQMTILDPTMYYCVFRVYCIYCILEVGRLTALISVVIPGSKPARSNSRSKFSTLKHHTSTQNIFLSPR